ncbi:MAG: hypothetical protein MUC65_06575 [Pontiellaceae bacterium]|nr:hypothetical protein [Pontiellaceae bacterium]
MKKLILRRRELVVALLSATLAGQTFSQVIANTTLDKKVIVGYQGWFGCAGDGSAANNWNHWQINKPDGRKIPAIDIWPKMGDYTETYNNGWTLRSGSAAKVFSAYDLSTVNVHFKWMQGFGIHGAFVGRQTKTIADGGNGKAFRDQVLRNVASACVTYGRVFYINYDISEEENNLSGSNINGNVFDRIKADADYWFGSSGFTATQKGRYVTISNKPVIRIFGVGSPRNKRTDGVWIFSADQARSKLDTLNNSYTVILGVNKSWRTLDNTNIRSDWRDTQAHKDAAMLVWKQAQYMQGWTVNAFTDTSGADSYYRNVLTADINWGKAQSPVVNVIPVIWPGFSWRNKQDGSVGYNTVPRGNGDFYWNNGYEAIKALIDRAAPVKSITVAMFDEIDEGTAIMKVECVLNNTPTTTSFSKLADGSSAAFITNVGGSNNQPDYFLWLTQQLKDDLAGLAPSATRPVR